MQTLTRVSFLCFVLFSAVSFSSANERRFAYTYETSVLPPGAREIETWNTYRTDKNYFYRRIDQRIEYEFGAAKDLMSALYLNYSVRIEDSNGEFAGGNTRKDYSLSISNEWKFKLADRVADPLGIGLYGEATLGLDEFELEGKLLIDKELNNTLLAFNGVIEQEWESDIDINGNTTTSQELKLEFDFGAAYSITRNASLGIEARQHNVVKNGEIEHSALFIGPVFSYVAEEWWSTITVQPQVKSFKGSATLDLAEYEKFQARLLFSFHI